MSAGFKAVSRCSLAAAAVLSVAACAPSDVSYSKDVQPILSSNCAECHAPGKKGFVAADGSGKVGFTLAPVMV